MRLYRVPISSLASIVLACIADRAIGVDRDGRGPLRVVWIEHAVFKLVNDSAGVRSPLFGTLHLNSMNPQVIQNIEGGLFSVRWCRRLVLRCSAQYMIGDGPQSPTSKILLSRCGRPGMLSPFRETVPYAFQIRAALELVVSTRTD